ncbi:MAG: GxxExxY protein [Chloroflexota bacterium]
MQGHTHTFTNISNKAIGCAIEVHRHLGPGLLESAYGNCYAHEFTLQGVPFKKEFPIPVDFKGLKIDCGYRADFLVADRLIVELKATVGIKPVHQAQLLTYMKLANVKQGLLINFNVELLKDGLYSFVL